MVAFKYKYRVAVFWIFHILLGFSISGGWGHVAVISLIPISVLSINQLSLTWRRFIFNHYIGQVLLMFFASWWFNDIMAIGWSDIAGLPPTFWLLILMLLLSLVISLFSSLPLLLFWLIGNRTIRPLIRTYIWAACMTLAEVIRSFVFSAIVRAEGMPIEPSWNLYSLAQLAPSMHVEMLGRALGFWGTSFALLLVSSCLAMVSILVYSKQKKPAASVLGMLVLLLVGGVLASHLYIGKSQTVPAKVYAVADNHARNDYLLGLLPALQQESTSKPIYVVLPEYSNFINPYGNTTMFNLNQDYREQYTAALKSNEIYFIGTEDVVIDNHRHAQSYVVDNQLQPLYTKGKTFLIPGGEYSPPWVKKFLGFFDEQSVYTFAQSTERVALNQTSGSSAAAGLPLSINACSSILQPYVYRSAVQDGALILTNNVSLEQFINAPEYGAYADRFARFISSSLSRPLVTGIRGGTAKIYDKNGGVLSQTATHDTFVSQTVAADNGKTLYALLGDTVILSLLLTPLFILVCWVVSKERKNLNRLSRRFVRSLRKK